MQWEDRGWISPGRCSSQVSSKTRNSRGASSRVADYLLLPDANVLLYGVNEDALQYERARAWLSKALAEREPIGFAWSVMLAFLRIATHPAIFDAPLGSQDAANALERWLASPSCVVVEPTARHLPLLRGLVAVAGTGGNLVSDAH